MFPRFSGLVPQQCVNQKMFEGWKTFAIREDGVKRCNVHSENEFVFAQEIGIAKYLKYVLTVFNVWR